MKKLFLAVAAALLASCATIGVKQPEPLPVPANLSPVQKAAAMLINEGLVNLTAGYSLVENLANQRLILKSEGRQYLAELDEADDGLEKARALYTGGDILGAQTQAELLNKGLVLLLTKLNEKKARK